MELVRTCPPMYAPICQQAQAMAQASDRVVDLVAKRSSVFESIFFRGKHLGSPKIAQGAFKL